MVTPESSDRGRVRASHADREQVVDALKAAFVQGRLTQDELDARAGQALAARTYADLAALTADLPAEPDRPPALAAAPAPAPAPAHNRPAKKAVKVGAGAIGAIILVTSVTAGIIGPPVAAVVIPIIAVLFTVFPAAFVAGLIALVLKAESWHQNRSRGQLPPGPASRHRHGHASPRPPTTDPGRPRPRRPPGSLAVGHAG